MAEKFYKQITLPSYESAAQAPPILPEKIGPYKIETLLAKGGMSLLYLGFDAKNQEPRAIKVLCPEYMNHPEMADHFLKEAKIIAMADHPNIVKLYEYGRWEEGLFIAMEFIRGISVRQFLTEQSFSLKRCLHITLQVAYALCHLHTHGVIHRDLKPENILIAEDGEVKVIDFGIAQLHEEAPHKTRQVMGTPSYMSPEQKEDPQAASFASDIFSLGIIAYELVLGKLSYGMINLSLLPPGLQRILGKALAVSAEQRYSDIVAFIRDLTDYYTSPEIDHERPSADLALEMGEALRKSEIRLSSFEKPNWSSFEVGLSHVRHKNEMGLYLDFFRFTNNVLALICAQTTTSTVGSVTEIATLCGMIKSLLAHHKASEAPFEPSSFAQTLNTLVVSDRMEATFHLSIVKLIPIQNTVVYLSCGPTAPLFHVPHGKHTPRTIQSENPLIGEQADSVFSESADTLEDGDLLVFHNLIEKSQPLEGAVASHSLLSPTRIAQALMELSDVESSSPKVTVALRRIS